MKEQIIRLRAEGKTYNEIRDITGASKGTISFHCGVGQKEKHRARNKKNRENKFNHEKQKQPKEKHRKTKESLTSKEQYYKHPKKCPCCGEIIRYERKQNTYCSLECTYKLRSKPSIQDSIAAIIMYNNGKSPHEIGLLLKRPVSTVYWWVNPKRAYKINKQKTYTIGSKLCTTEEEIIKSLTEICNENTSMRSAQKASGLSRNIFKTLAKKYGVYKTNPGGKGTHKKSPIPCVPLDKILRGEYGAYSSSKLRKRLIDAGIKNAECECCGLTDWLGKPIPLELEHVNGNHNDNRLCNLKILCPNCHADTPFYRGRNTKRHKDKKAKNDIFSLIISYLYDC